MMRKFGVTVIIWLLLSFASVTTAWGQSGQTVTLEQFNQAIAERDRIIIELVNRVEALEKRPQNASASSVLDKPSDTVVTLAGRDKSPPAPKQSVIAPATRPGALHVDEISAARALERGLVNDGTLLLSAGQIEMVPSLQFQRQEFDQATAVAIGGSTFVGDAKSNFNVFDSTLAARLGLPWNAQFEASMPYRFVLNDRTTTARNSIVSSDDGDGSGVGDVRLGLAKTLLEEEDGWTNLIGRVTWDSASGPKRDGDQVLGFGFDELGASLTASVSSDPMIFFGSFGFDYSFESDDLKPGREFRLLLGTAVAVSPETSLTFSLDQSYRREFELNGQDVDGSDSLASSFNFGLSSLLGSQTLLQISAGIGLTKDAPGYMIGISMPIRFDSGLF